MPIITNTRLTLEEKIAMLLAFVFVVYFFSSLIFLIKQNFHIQELENKILKQNKIIENLQQQDFRNTKEYKAIKKCKTEKYWKAECIAWKLNK